MSRKLTVTLNVEDWVEIVASLETKIHRIEHGHFGPEERPGEDALWVTHLKQIKISIEKVLYSKK